MLGALALVGTYLLVLILHLVIPGRTVKGYVRERYHLNGLRVFIVCVVGYVTLMPLDFFYVHRFETLATAFVIGLLFTVIVVGREKPVRGWLADLYLGRAENPQWGKVDAKMFLYLVGAVMLALNIISFASVDPTPGVLLYAALFLFFLTEYLFFEEVHLYTYDFVAERVGFKLGWGCLVFYPFFYCIGVWFGPHAQQPVWVLVLAAVMFFSGWALARGANMQKFYFKTQPQKTHFGPIAQRSLEQRVLISGFWGLSRHINYLGELLMASGLALAVGHPAAWAYPAYYLVLLIPRQLDDDRRCAQKYGAMWLKYKEAVPYRIVPFIY